MNRSGEDQFLSGHQNIPTKYDEDYAGGFFLVVSTFAYAAQGNALHSVHVWMGFYL